MPTVWPDKRIPEYPLRIMMYIVGRSDKAVGIREIA
jgi:hypothetical protein